MRKHLIIALALFLMVFISACQAAAVEAPKEEELVPVEELKAAIPLEEDALDALKREIQDEMRVFDVVEHHDDLYALVVATASPKDNDDQLNSEIGEIVKTYMDEQLEARIIEGLSAIEPNYSEDDAAWLMHSIYTDDLYRLITVYEREFYKRNHHE